MADKTYPNFNRKDRPNKNLRSDSKDEYVLESLRNARLNKGYTTYRVAREVGITVMSYVHYERLRAFPTSEHALRVSELLQQPRDYLFPPCLPYLVQLVASYRRGQDFLPSEIEREVPLFVPLDHFIHLPAEDSSDGREVSPSLQKYLYYLLQNLPIRQQQFLLVRYGFISGQSCNRSEAAHRLGFSKQNAKQLEERALKNLRQSFGSFSLEDYLLSMR
ncbi:MAG: sigma factor-like helix-turn-helix DNA-binding protein [Nanoarchaeota archaeon]